tara:strand:+ start:51 stop:1484 length:1434 start_codon:yes stop_codon:yes gene_type:complete
MSINATKRKAVSKYKISQIVTPVKKWVNQGPFGDSNNEVSSLASGFSINGGTRNIGYVGETNLGKTSKSCCTNNSDYIKPSVLSTKGMLAKKNKWLEGKGNIVKPDDNIPDNFSQSQYIESKQVSEVTTVELPRQSLSSHVYLQRIKKPLISRTGSQMNKYLTTGNNETLCDCNPPINVVTNFVPGGDNRIFADESLHHHILIVPSGSGQRNPNSGGVNGITGVTLTGPYFNPYGLAYSEGIVGFNSNAEPNPTPYYAAFTDTGDTCPSTLHITPNAAIVSQNSWSLQGRYLRSKSVGEMVINPQEMYPGGQLQPASDAELLKNWDQLVDMKITWIAGNNNNGGDRPDMFAFNSGDPNQTGLPTDGPFGDYRKPENLYVQFFDHNDQAMGQEFILWRTKRDPTPAELAAAIADPTINAWSNIPVNEYPSNVFTETTIKAADFGIDLSQAKFFIIRQYRHTDKWDNYAVKHVELNFKY